MSEQRDRAQRLLVVANRLPFTAIEKEGRLTFEPSAGGLVSGLTGYLQPAGNDGSIDEYLWIGWPGSSVDPARQNELKQKARELNAHPVFISEADVPNACENSSRTARASSALAPLRRSTTNNSPSV